MNPAESAKFPVLDLRHKLEDEISIQFERYGFAGERWLSWERLQHVELHSELVDGGQTTDGLCVFRAGKVHGCGAGRSGQGRRDDGRSGAVGSGATVMPPISAPASAVVSARQVAHIDLAESNARWYNVLRADQKESRAGQEHRGSAGAATTPTVLPF